MHREIDKDKSFQRGHTFSLFCRKACLPGVFCLALVWMQLLAVGMPVAYASGPGGDVTNPSVLAVDIAKPAIVRIITQVVGQLTVKFSNGQSVTFPQAPENGVNGYTVGLSGSGAFISAHGDILTADHVINPIVDDRKAVDQGLYQYTQAPTDIANYINQNLHPTQQATADQVTQELTSGQLQSTSQYQKPESQVLLSTDFSGPLNGVSLQNLPPSQIANVNKIEAESLTSQTDTAIIHVNGMDNMPMLQVGDSTTVHQLDQLTILGYPGIADIGTSAGDFLTSTIVTVSVSALKADPTSGAPIIQIDGNVQQGNSGGPALNSNGQIVGIVSFGIPGTPTSYLQASSSAQKLMQKINIDTTTSLFQQAWSKAMNDYASTIPGHWHQSMREFQQIANQYPSFKAVNQYLQYAQQQAKSEKQTQETTTSTQTTNTAHTSATTSTSNFNSLILYGGIGIAVLLLIVLILAFSRRRKPAVATVPGTPIPGAGAMPGGPGMPQTPGYPGQAAYPPPQNYGYPAGQPGQPITPAPSTQQPGYRPMPPVTPAPSAPQPGYRPAQPQSTASSMAAFGAPVPTTPQPGTSGPDVTIVAQPRKPVPQWRTWPCGHINREDARFCGTCGEPAPPPPQVRRVEQ